MKCDPTKLQVRDIRDCAYDSLSRSLRESMKERGVKGRFKVVYSSEKTERKLMELEDFQKENPDNFRALPNMRLRIIPVLGTMPALFG